MTSLSDGLLDEQDEQDEQNSLSYIESRFWAFVEIPEDDEDCWIWKGYSSGGYAKLPIWQKGKTVMLLAHRVSYELHFEPVPESLVVDHMCEVTMCVNPLHLDVVTHRENIRRSSESRFVKRRVGSVAH